MSWEQQKAVAHKLVDAVLAKGHRARWDFEDEFTTDAEALKRDADACEIQTLYVEKTASFCIVYGNAEDGSELIADFTDNEFANAIYKEVYPDGTD